MFPHFSSPVYLPYMQRVDELIEKFWTDKLSDDERSLLSELLTRHEQELTDSMRTVFLLIREERKKIVEPEKSRRILEQLHRRIQNAEDVRGRKEYGLSSGPGREETVVRKARIVRMPRRIGWAAAVVIFLLGLGIFTGVIHNPWSSSLLARYATTGRYLKTIANHSDTVKILELPDGSVAALEGNSALSYYAPFYDSSRDISLAGKATFKVAKKPGQPFTVYAGGMATTALGTTFTVNTLVADRVSIVLLEGKVVVRSADSSKGSVIHPVFLDPGQELTLNQVTHQFLVGNVIKSGAVARTAGRANDDRVIKSAHAGNTDTVLLSFSNEPLASVFHKLNKLYAIDIRCGKKDIEGLYFTGTILKGDSIHTVLSAIGNMNRLLFTQGKGIIQVKKSD